MSKPSSQFRRWVQTIWEENCDEHDLYGEVRYTHAQYWHRYRYWLKGRYQQLRRTGVL